jgi:hypothetical protein
MPFSLIASRHAALAFRRSKRDAVATLGTTLQAQPSA